MNFLIKMKKTNKWFITLNNNYTVRNIIKDAFLTFYSDLCLKHFFFTFFTKFLPINYINKKN